MLRPGETSRTPVNVAAWLSRPSTDCEYAGQYDSSLEPRDQPLELYAPALLAVSGKRIVRNGIVMSDDVAEVRVLRVRVPDGLVRRVVARAPLTSDQRPSHCTPSGLERNP